jgi:HTH-type transcriptional regulator / antitoxin HigA
MDIRPIHNDDDHRAALVEIENLWDAPEGSDDAIKLDLLVTMVERYEAKRWPIRKPKWGPIDVLHYAIDEMGHTQTELAEILGSRSRASEISITATRAHDRDDLPYPQCVENSA